MQLSSTIKILINYCRVCVSNLHSTRDELLAHFSIPFWLHILIGQGYVCAIKHAKADWLMTYAKADWLTTNVIIFPCSLIGQFKISLCFDFGCDVACIYLVLKHN